MSINQRQYAEELLIYFVKNFSELYGMQYMSYNVHNLIHLAKDVAHFSPLDSFSAFKFENFLYKLKRKVHTGKHYLEQICNRLHDSTHSVQKTEIKIFPIIHSKNDIIYKVQLPGFTLSTKEFDNCCILHDGLIIFIENISYDEERDNISFAGKSVTKTKSFFSTPCDSTNLSIFLISKLDMFAIDSVNINEVSEKGVIIEIGSEECVILPLIHSHVQN